MNFGILTSDVLDYINRPAGEMSTQVQREINNAILWAQRKHAFKYTERLVEALYPANTLLLNLTEVCDGLPRNYLNVQAIAETGRNEGKLLEITSFHSAQRKRLEYQKNHPAPEDTQQQLDDPYQHSSVQNRFHGPKFCLIERNVSLYPVPTQDILLLINLHVWLPVLVNDADTNFLFTFGYDFLLDKTVERMSTYLKMDDRYEVTKKNALESFEALKEWDAQITTSTDAP